MSEIRLVGMRLIDGQLQPAECAAHEPAWDAAITEEELLGAFRTVLGKHPPADPEVGQLLAKLRNAFSPKGETER